MALSISPHEHSRRRFLRQSFAFSALASMGALSELAESREASVIRTSTGLSPVGDRMKEDIGGPDYV
jgi:hypothetical protein